MDRLTVLFALLTMCICMLIRRLWTLCDHARLWFSQRVDCMDRILGICRELQQEPRLHPTTPGLAYGPGFPETLYEGILKVILMK